MPYFHAVFHGLKAASQSVLLLFINILLLGQGKKKRKLKSTKAQLLDLNARLLLRANFSSFKQNLRNLRETSYFRDYLFRCYPAVNLCNSDRCGCIRYVSTVCYGNWMSVCISLSLSFLHFLFLTRSGTVHILHNNMSPALSQWWYSQHLALYHDLHFSYVSSFSAQRHHWVPQHLFPAHGYMWAHTNQIIIPT